MKAQHLSLALAALLAAGGSWLAWSAWRKQTSQNSNMGAGVRISHGEALSRSNFLDDSRRLSGPETDPEIYRTSSASPDRMLNSPGPLAPPVPNQRFTDFTPEERVRFARQGHGPGG